MAMIFSEYVALILLCKQCKFGEKNLQFTTIRDIEVFLGVTFLAHPVDRFYARRRHGWPCI